MNYAASKKLALLPCLKHSLKALIVFWIVTWTSVAVHAQNYQWAGSTNGNGTAEGFTITEDAFGNVYVAGIFEDETDFNPGPGSAILHSNGGQDAFLAKYDVNGNFLWAFNLGGITHDWAKSIAIDSQGNVLLVGLIQATTDFDPGSGTVNLNPMDGTDVFMAKYDSNGNYLWVKSIGGLQNALSSCVSLDAQGNIYLSGEYHGTVDFDPSIGTYYLSAEPGFGAAFFAKYDANGGFIWAKSIGKFVLERSTSMAFGPGGNLHITGYFEGTSDFDPGIGVANLTSEGGDDIFLCKFDNNGDLLFAESMGGPQDEHGLSIAVNSGGYIYIAGWFLGPSDFNPDTSTAILTSSGDRDMFFAKYDADGHYQWANAIGGVEEDMGLSIAANSFGTMFLTGVFRDTVDFDPGPSTAKLSAYSARDAFLAKYDPDGHYQWAFALRGDRGDYGYDVSLGDANAIYLTGAFHNTVDFDPGVSTAYLTSFGVTAAYWAKYADPALYVSPNVQSHITVYPNPAHDMIRFSEIVNVELHHITGVSILRAKNVTSLDLGDYESGIYIATLTNASGRVLQRLKLIKE